MDVCKSSPIIPPSSPPERIDHPPHYQGRAGVECIDLVEDLDFLTGNIIKYAFRCGKKEGVSSLEDLKKCRWYVERAIQREERREAAPR